MPRPKPDPKLVAAVVGAWASGATIEFAAASNGVKLGTANDWIEQAKIRLEERLRPRIANENQIDWQTKFEEMLAAFIDAQIALARHFQNPDWLYAQDAQSLFVGIGILNDKSGRMARGLIAVGASPEPDDAGSDGAVPGTYRELSSPAGS